MKAALHEGRRLARYRKLDGARGRGSLDLRLRADEERLQQPLVTDLDRGQDGFRRAGMDDRGAQRRQGTGLCHDAVVAIGMLQRDFGKAQARPGHALAGCHHRRRAGQNRFAALVGASGIQHDGSLRRLLASDRDGRRNGIAGRDRLQEAQILPEIDRTRSGQLRAEHRRDQRRGPHAVRHDMPERISRSEGCIQMGGVGILRDGSEQLDVVRLDDADGDALSPIAISSNVRLVRSS